MIFTVSLLIPAFTQPGSLRCLKSSYCLRHCFESKVHHMRGICQEFTYRKFTQPSSCVYTIVLFEHSPAEFKKFPGTYYHCFEFYVQPIPDFGAYITSPCLYTPSRSRMCGFFSPFSLLSPVPIESAVYIWICSVITRRRTRLLGFASSTNSLPFHKHALPTVCNTRYLRVLFRH